MFFILFHIGFTGIGMLLFLTCYGKIARYRKVKKVGQYVRGTITDRERGVNGHTPIISFTALSGEKVEGKARNLRKVRDLFNEGERIDLFYLPQDTKVFVVDVFLLNVLQYIGLLAGSIIFLFGTISLAEML